MKSMEFLTSRTRLERLVLYHIASSSAAAASPVTKQDCGVVSTSSSLQNYVEKLDI